MGLSIQQQGMQILQMCWDVLEISIDIILSIVKIQLEFLDVLLVDWNLCVWQPRFGSRSHLKPLDLLKAGAKRLFIKDNGRSKLLMNAFNISVAVYALCAILCVIPMVTLHTTIFIKKGEYFHSRFLLWTVWLCTDCLIDILALLHLIDKLHL